MVGELSLYFHIPFCTKKCPYCHFFVVKDDPKYHQRFLDALKKEWALKKIGLQNKKLVSVYFGGGTASLLSLEAYEEIFSWLRPYLTPEVEITLEANPEALELDYLKKCRSLGFNRISLGVQTLDNKLLKKIGRGHLAEEAINAVGNAKVSGFDNISLDLMYDLPLQTVESFEKTLKQVADLPITHLSLYNLTIEPFTPFYRKKELLKKELPTPEQSLQLLESALMHLDLANFARYEISAFAREGLLSKHNSGYWTGRPFLGFGPSAFSYSEGSRFSNVSNLIEYEKRLHEGSIPIDFSEILAPEDSYRELLAIRLRLLEWYTPLNVPIALEKTLEELVEEGFLEKKNHAYRLSCRGALFYDTVASKII